jgi:hypothetical protein
MTAQGPDRSDGDHDVLSNLPRSRPHRRSAKRGGVTATKTKAAQASEAGESAAGAAKPADGPKAARKPAAAKAKPKTTTAAEAAAKQPAPNAAPRAAGAGAGPRAQRLRKPPPPPSPLPPKAGKTAPPKGESQTSGTELIGTVVQAAGELAQVGLTIGGQVLKRAVSRLPKP